jgi:3-methyladenine DNA glycosylase/8-oxoguanine DNA glycosylase
MSLESSRTLVGICGDRRICDVVYLPPVSTIEIVLKGPGGEPVDLARTLNSHGFAGLAPSQPIEDAGALMITLRIPGGRPRRVRIEPGRTGRVRAKILGPAAGPRAQAAVRSGVRHVLRLDQDLSGFYAQVAEDPDLAWAAAGAGRMLQSPTVFEDTVKTVCTTNCTWSATQRMVDALVVHLGDPCSPRGSEPRANAFPTPAVMAAAPESFYRDTARAGYRGAYLISLARLVAEGAIDLDALAAPGSDGLPDDELEARLLELPGVGPYAAAHIMMTMGRNSRLILDSWTRPTYASKLGRTRLVSDAAIRRRFRRYGDQAGLAFWLFVTRDWGA